MRIAVTGVSGFVGSNLFAHLASHGHEVRAVSRGQIETFDMTGLDAIIHCAAIAHRKSVPLGQYDETNHHMPVRLAKRAAAVGVCRFVFVSSINVVAGNPGTLTPDMPQAPISDYGKTKAAAEFDLLNLSGIEVVIARPCLVYGKDAPGNMRLLTRLARSPIPLPFGLTRNRRSFVSIGNCVGALAFLATAEGVAGGIFHLADPETYSTADLARTLRAALDRPPMLLPIPSRVMAFTLGAVGRRDMAAQLYGDLVVDSSSLVSAGFSFSDGLPHLIAMIRGAGPR